MLFLLKYRFLQIVREFLCHVLGTCIPTSYLPHFFISALAVRDFLLPGESEWDKIKVCVVTSQQETADSAAFLNFLDAMEQQTLEILPCDSEKDALEALNQGTISGIYYASESPSLSVGKMDYRRVS